MTWQLLRRKNPLLYPSASPEFEIVAERDKEADIDAMLERRLNDREYEYTVRQSPLTHKSD